MVFPHSLGFLTEWQPHDGWTSRRTGQDIPANKPETVWPSVPQPQKSHGHTSAIVPWSEPSQACPDSRQGDIDPTLSMGGMPNNLQS